MTNEIKINKANKSLTFINNGIAYSQFGIADEILDLITNLQEENKYLKFQIECYSNKDKPKDKMIEKLALENERLKNGYCELKVKCNNGECDCTNEEYDGMVQANIKLSLETDKLTAESTEWENKCYQLQDTLYNIQQEIEKLNQYDYNDHNLMVVLNHIEEIVNGK